MHTSLPETSKMVIIGQHRYKYVPNHLNMGSIAKPWHHRIRLEKIALKKSYSQSCNYHILQSKVKKQEKSIYFKILGNEQSLKRSALKPKFKPKMDIYQETRWILLLISLFGSKKTLAHSSPA